MVLDCTYLNHNDYVRRWSWMIQNIPAADRRDRVVEINVPFAAGDRKHDYSKDKAEKSNTSCSTCAARAT